MIYTAIVNEFYPRNQFEPDLFWQLLGKHLIEAKFLQFFNLLDFQVKIVKKMLKTQINIFLLDKVGLNQTF